MERLKKTRFFKVRHPPATRHRHPTSKRLSRLFGNCPPVERMLAAHSRSTLGAVGKASAGQGAARWGRLLARWGLLQQGGWLAGAHVSPRLVWFCPRDIWHRLSSRVRAQMSGPGVQDRPATGTQGSRPGAAQPAAGRGGTGVLVRPPTVPRETGTRVLTPTHTRIYLHTPTLTYTYSYTLTHTHKPTPPQTLIHKHPHTLICIHLHSHTHTR